MIDILCGVFFICWANKLGCFDTVYSLISPTYSSFVVTSFKCWKHWVPYLVPAIQKKLELLCSKQLLLISTSFFFSALLQKNSCTLDSPFYFSSLQKLKQERYTLNSTHSSKFIPPLVEPRCRGILLRINKLKANSQLLKWGHTANQRFL